jgi:hypothetical protein
VTLVTQCHLHVDQRNSVASVAEASIDSDYREPLSTAHDGWAGETKDSDSARAARDGENSCLTLLHECAFHNAPECATYLIKHRCDVSLTDKRGIIEPGLVGRCSSRMLLSHAHTRGRARDAGFTALFIAAMRGNLETLVFLLPEWHVVRDEMDPFKQTSNNAFSHGQRAIVGSPPLMKSLSWSFPLFLAVPSLRIGPLVLVSSSYARGRLARPRAAGVFLGAEVRRNAGRSGGARPGGHALHAAHAGCAQRTPRVRQGTTLLAAEPRWKGHVSTGHACMHAFRGAARTLCCPPLRSFPYLSCPVLSCPVLSCPVLSCPVLSCPVLSCPVL